MHRRRGRRWWRIVAGSAVAGVVGCAPTADEDGTNGATSAGPTSAGPTSGEPTTAGDATAASGASTGPAATSAASSGGDTTASDTGPSDCTFCDGPNEVCIDDVCVTTCQGQMPDPCGPMEVCDVISGQCHAPSDPCTLAGDYIGCGAASCGPGSVCDNQGACVPLAPCGDVACLDDGTCWGTACLCERQSECPSAPDEVALNGPFSVDIGDLEFADDCTAWMVTLRSGTDYVRRLELDGTLTEWAGVANLNMGEIKVLKALAPPAGIDAGDPTRLAAGGASPRPGDAYRRPPMAVEGIGEVAITYTCCATCGCFVDPPQGVARLVENDPVNPLPLVIEAVITQGDGPFGSPAADAGPQGLTWGIDRVLYVGNSTANGELASADLDAGTQAVLATLPGRVTAGAPISPVHNLFAVEGGALFIFNVETLNVSMIGRLGADVTSLSHDAFSGLVYASLSDLTIAAIRPFTAEIVPFGAMPAPGRVSVSPDGQLWYVPMKFMGIVDPIAPWDLPDAL